MTTSTKYLALIPRDGFFVKDGRGWQTSASGRGYGLDWPWPSTVLGSLRALWGRAEEHRNNTTWDRTKWQAFTMDVRLGRTLVLHRKVGAHWCHENTMWPAPSDALWLAGRSEVERLDPERPHAPTLGRDDDEAREALWRPVLNTREKPHPLPRWWSHEKWIAWLVGLPVCLGDKDKALVPRKRQQIHVGIRSQEGTAEDGILFSHDVVETLDREGDQFNEWAIGVEVELPKHGGTLPDIAMLGTGPRISRVEALPPSMFEPPTSVLEAFRASPSRGLRLVAVTPLCFDQGWLPNGFENKNGVYYGKIGSLDVMLRAAFVPRPVHVVGWDMAKREPRPTARMVAPGAVYFFERTDRKPFGETEAKSLWLHAIGNRIDEGFGRVVPGIWTPKGEER